MGSSRAQTLASQTARSARTKLWHTNHGAAQQMQFQWNWMETTFTLRREHRADEIVFFFRCLSIFVVFWRVWVPTRGRRRSIGLVHWPSQSLEFTRISSRRMPSGLPNFSKRDTNNIRWPISDGSNGLAMSEGKINCTHKTLGNVVLVAIIRIHTYSWPIWCAHDTRARKKCQIRHLVSLHFAVVQQKRARAELATEHYFVSTPTKVKWTWRWVKVRAVDAQLAFFEQAVEWTRETENMLIGWQVRTWFRRTWRAGTYRFGQKFDSTIKLVFSPRDMGVRVFNRHILIHNRIAENENNFSGIFGIRWNSFQANDLNETPLSSSPCQWLPLVPHEFSILSQPNILQNIWRKKLVPSCA